MRLSCACASVFLLTSIATAAPMTPLRSASDLLQQVVAPAHPQSREPSQPSTRRLTPLEPAPNSVGVLFTTAEQEDVVHLWLPLGQKLYSRACLRIPPSLAPLPATDTVNDVGNNPILPLHPLSARITTMINSSPEEATPERLDEIECTISPVVNRTSDAEKRWEARFGRRNGKGAGQQTGRSVSFRRGDGMVRLAEVGSRFWIDGREVEGVECR